MGGRLGQLQAAPAQRLPAPNPPAPGAALAPHQRQEVSEKGQRAADERQKGDIGGGDGEALAHVTRRHGALQGGAGGADKGGPSTLSVPVRGERAGRAAWWAAGQAGSVGDGSGGSRRQQAAGALKGGRHRAPTAPLPLGAHLLGVHHLQLNRLVRGAGVDLQAGVGGLGRGGLAPAVHLLCPQARHRPRAAPASAQPHAPTW